MSRIKTESTVYELIEQIAQALNEADEHAELYSVLAPIVIAGYGDIAPEEIGYRPSGEFGMCHGHVPGERAKNVQETVDMFMGLAISLGWSDTRGRNGRAKINMEALELTFRLDQLGLRLRPAGYPEGTWTVYSKGNSLGDGSSNVLTGFSDLDDPRLLYALSQLERAGSGLAELGIGVVDVLASHAITTYDAGLTATGKGMYGMHVATLGD
jgi:hypothetical protein